jgi:hypothetical protein
VFEHHRFDFLYLYRIPRSLWVNFRNRRPPIFLTPGPDLDRSIEVLEYGRELAAERGGRFVVVLLGTRNTFRMRSRFATPWARFEQALEEAQIEHLSLADELYGLFQEDPHSVINEGGSHYTPFAHGVVAQRVVESEVVRRLGVGGPGSAAAR